jgi:hypothetical protein
LDGTGLRFETMDHGGEYPDAMPQAIRLTDADGRSCIYVPITQRDRVVDSAGMALDDEEEYAWCSVKNSRMSQRLSLSGCRDDISSGSFMENDDQPIQSDRSRQARWL